MNGIVTVHALSAGHLTLPEKFFISPLESSSLEARRTVPSLSFLIKHQDVSSQEPPTYVLFDLGLRKHLSLYSQQIQAHAETRKPISSQPDVLTSLQEGGLNADDIDLIVLSHVHWDHIGYPKDFNKSTFVVGNGTPGLLDGSVKLTNGSHSHFEAGLLPLERTIELQDPNQLTDPCSAIGPEILSHIYLNRWASRGIFPHTIDIFNDGSCYIVSAPGHLPGHLNLLCRLSRNTDRYVLLAGDVCHDRRLLTGEKDVAEWDDPALPGVKCCIHTDKRLALDTLQRIKSVEKGDCEELGGVEVVFAHDPIWEEAARKMGRFWPGKL